MLYFLSIVNYLGISYWDVYLAGSREYISKVGKDAKMHHFTPSTHAAWC